jgi:hypothetical protein
MTQSDLVSDLRYLTGNNEHTLSPEDACSLLSRGLDHYSYLAITSDGKWQFDDTGNTADVPRASLTLQAGEVAVPLEATHLTVNFVELTDPDGQKLRLDTFDRRQSGYTTPKTSDTGKPTAYNYEAGVIYFDKYTDKAGYVITVHFSRPVSPLDPQNASQTVGIPTIHREYPVLYAAHREAVRTGNENRATLRQELEMMEKDVRHFYAVRDEDTNPRLSMRIRLAR